ncbi:MAG: hypothetical protein CMC86_01290 [Flavobacteriaceae bacterium]|nr:hypothetical protein [Flavobacteriaceae bacterium]
MVISFILALILALLYYKPWRYTIKVYWLLTFFRALSFSALFLLLLNPKLQISSTNIVKPKLLILADNTESISYLNKAVSMNSAINLLTSNKVLNQKFDLQTYSFDTDIKILDSLNFKSKQTNINNSIRAVNEIYKDQVAPIILITDGNQTVGNSYLYNDYENGQSIYPIVLGDTTTYVDLKIQQINVNKYTFLGNTFPIEIFVNYNGTQPVRTNLKVYSGKTLKFTKSIELSSERNSQTITTFLETKKVGLNRYKVIVDPTEEEILLSNNTSIFGIEAIDQKLKIALISNTPHPDLAFFKAILGSDKNYEINQIEPKHFLQQPTKYNIAILYQPTSEFSQVFKSIEKYNLNSFIIAGTFTDWKYLNSAQSSYVHEYTGQNEDYQSLFNSSFDNFSLDFMDFENYPPLTSSFGNTNINIAHNVLLYKYKNGVNTNQPLLFTYSKENSRQVVLLAENIWKWRMHCFREEKSFKKIDNYFKSIFQYLSTQRSTERLRINHELIFDGSVPVSIYAQFYGENFKLNNEVDLQIEIESSDNTILKFPMVLQNNSYVTNLQALEPGSYKYNVKVIDKGFVKSGRFEILPFNIEFQFINSDFIKLRQLAKKTNGKMFFNSETDLLINKLIEEEVYKDILQVEKKSLPLINFKYILLLIIFSLASEWFIRKYNGLI